MKNVLEKLAFGLASLPLLCNAATPAADEQAVFSKLYGLRPSYDSCLAKADASTAALKACMEEELGH